MEIQKKIEVQAIVTVDLVLRHDIVEHFNQLQKAMMTQTIVKEMINLWLKQLADATLKSMILKKHIDDDSVLTMKSDYPSDKVICTLDMHSVREFTAEDNDYNAAEIYKLNYKKLNRLFDALERNITDCVEWISDNGQILTPYKRNILDFDINVKKVNS